MLGQTHSTSSDTSCPRSQPSVVRHLNQHQLAQRWGISPRTLERWRWLGLGPAYLKLVGTVAYRLEDIVAYEKAQRVVASGANLVRGVAR
jgi:hypothetical protein